MPNDIEPTATTPPTRPSPWERLKHLLLELEIEALEVEHKTLTEVDSVFARLRAKL